MSFKLSKEAAQFASELSGLLNATVADGVRLGAVGLPLGESETYVIGRGITKTNLTSNEAIHCAGKPGVDLVVSFRLQADHENRYLMVRSSAFILTPRGSDSTLMHIDYERDKRDNYPEAHLQICGESDDWATVLGERPLGRLHFPVGGRRYRPTLEDLVEFLIRENLATGRPGWETQVESGRIGFQKKQLRAAIRQEEGVAVEFLRSRGWAIEPRPT